MHVKLKSHGWLFQTFKHKLFRTRQKEKGGRNVQGKITVRHQASAKLKFMYSTNFNLMINKHVRMISKFLFWFKNKPFQALVKYADGAYTITNTYYGSFFGNINRTCFVTWMLYKNKVGDACLLYLLKIHTIFYNFVNQNKKLRYAKAAGAYCLLLKHYYYYEYCYIRLPSGTKVLIPSSIYVILGRNSNLLNTAIKIRKAGQNHLLGKRASVRGVAMNPVDHPHGGRTKTNQPEVTPWNKIAKKNK